MLHTLFLDHDFQFKPWSEKSFRLIFYIWQPPISFIISVTGRGNKLKGLHFHFTSFKRLNRFFFIFPPFSIIKIIHIYTFYTIESSIIKESNVSVIFNLKNDPKFFIRLIFWEIFFNFNLCFWIIIIQPLSICLINTIEGFCRF